MIDAFDEVDWNAFNAVVDVSLEIGFIATAQQMRGNGLRKGLLYVPLSIRHPASEFCWKYDE